MKGGKYAETMLAKILVRGIICIHTRYLKKCFTQIYRGGWGQGGRSPGEQGAGGVPEMVEERAGSRISTMAGSGREIQKGKLSLFVTAYIQSKSRTQQHFLTSI